MRASDLAVRYTLKDYQEGAVADVLERLARAREELASVAVARSVLPDGNDRCGQDGDGGGRDRGAI